jgi:hypothetical protein
MLLAGCTSSTDPVVLTNMSIPPNHQTPATAISNAISQALPPQ